MWRTAVFGLVLAGIGFVETQWPPARDFTAGHFDNNVGYLYSRGLGVHRDPGEAVHWWRAAAAHGSPAGELNLAFALQNGTGVVMNEEQAAFWYERAARRGSPEAANNLGSLYTNPATRRPDLVMARAWFKRALAGGDREFARTVAENLRTVEEDMTPAQIAASDTILGDLR